MYCTYMHAGSWPQLPPNHDVRMRKLASLHDLTLGLDDYITHAGSPWDLPYRVDSRIISQPSLEDNTDAHVLVNISASETYV
jgi:hypothetical protein